MSKLLSTLLVLKLVVGAPFGFPFGLSLFNAYYRWKPRSRPQYLLVVGLSSVIVSYANHL